MRRDNWIVETVKGNLGPAGAGLLTFSAASLGGAGVAGAQDGAEVLGALGALGLDPGTLGIVAALLTGLVGAYREHLKGNGARAERLAAELVGAEAREEKLLKELFEAQAALRELATREDE